MHSQSMSSTPSQIDILIDKIIMKVFSMKSIRIITKIFESVSMSQNVKFLLAFSANYPEEERWGQHSLVIIKIRQPANYPGVQIIHSMSTTGFSHFANDLRDRLSSFTHVAVLATMRQQIICHNVLFILFVNTVYSINPCTP